ncbi:MAG: hypothetical protein ACTSSK_05575 [Candidatus Heimdallarchaeota archaeon]
MKRSRLFALLIIGLVISLINNNGFQKTNASSFQKIDIKITEISWIKSNDFGSSFENKSVIKITTSLEINNPNNESLLLRHPTYPYQTYGTNAEITLKDKALETLFWCECGSMYQSEANSSLPAGFSINESISYLIIEEKGIENLPDGRYIIWNYIYAYNSENLSVSTKALVRISNGIPTIDYNYTPGILLSIPRFYIIFTVITAASLVIYSRKIFRK